MLNRASRHPVGRRALPTALVALMMATAMVVPASPVFAAETITLSPTQPVYLVNNGATANVGFRMTYTGTPDSGTNLDREITLSLTTGATLTVGGTVGSANTTLAGGSTTIAGGSSTLLAGSTTLSAAAAAGATNIKVGSVSNFVANQVIAIDTGFNLETRTIVSVGGTGLSGSGITVTPALGLAHLAGVAAATAAPIGATMLRIGSSANFAAGQTVNIDTAANLETATVAVAGVGGSTTLGLPTAVGDVVIKVPSITSFVAGGTIYIDQGVNIEPAVVATVGTAGASTVRTATLAGATNIPVVSSSGFATGNTITIDSGANLETAVIASTSGGGSPSVTVTVPLANAHAVGVQVSGSGITLTAPLASAHATGAAASGNGLTLSAGLTKLHTGAAAVATVTPAGVTNIKVVSVAGFAVGDTVTIDTGTTLETAVIAAIGTAGATGTGIDLTTPLAFTHTGAPAMRVTSALAGATNVKVNAVMGYYPGDTITIDTSANQEVRTVVAVGTAGLAGTGIDITPPLSFTHFAGATVTDTRALPSTAVAGVDYTVPSATVIIPAGSPSGTIVTIRVVTAVNPNPSVALTINTTAACTGGCTGVTVNNNDPSTVVINAHGFPYLNSSLSIPARVADLMSRMSLLDKVGQMDQTLMSVANNGTTTNNSSWNNLRAWRLGSILSGGSDNPNPNNPTGWADLVDAFQSRALTTPLQIPMIYGEDTIHGNAHMIGATAFPHDIGMGATHNPDLSYQQGVITAQETRSAGPQWGFGPTICAARDIRWGRTYECYSEEPALVNLMETIIDGYQGTNPVDKSGMHILASAKHFAGDGATQNGRNAGIDVMSSEEFARVALAQYIPAVQQHHTGTIMPSYSSVQLDGATTSILMSANRDLMTGWLKNTTGFGGFLISDYSAINSIPVPSPNPLPAPLNQSYAYQTMISFNAGMDMVMAPSVTDFKNFINYLQELQGQGFVPMSRIDDAVVRILTQKFELGMFEQPFTDRSTQSQINSPAHKAVARQAAAESQVLLKNSSNLLPLSKTARVYLAGSNADNVISQMGGWSVGWQSIPTGDVPAVNPFVTTMKEALEGVVGAGNVTYSATVPTPPAAGTYDVGIVVVGETAYAEGSGDVPGSQTDAPTTADAMAIANVCGIMPCVILSMAGRPFMVTDAQFNQAGAVVATWLPGSEGEGVTDVLFGDVPFSGRLPMTWPKTIAQEPINVGDPTYDPRFPFGWGLRTGTTFSTKASLVAARASLATITGDAHVTAAIAYLDTLLVAPVWNVNGSPLHVGQIDWWLQKAANELALTAAASFTQQDSVVSAARDIAQTAVVAAGGPNSITSPLIGDADVALLNGHPDVAVTKLTQAAGLSAAATTTTVVTADFDPTQYGKPVTFTATVAATDPIGSGIPTGTVQFSIDSVAVGSPVLLDAAGKATFTTSALAIGTHTVSADYAGQNYFLASSSAPINHTVTKRLGTSTRVTSSLNPSVFGDAVTFIATVSLVKPSSGFTPTGFVQWQIDGVMVGGSVALDASAQATMTTNSLNAAHHNIRAVYLGGVSYTGSTSPVLVQTVKQATPTGSVVAAPPSPIVSGTKPMIFAATFSTTVTIGSLTPANVQFSIDGTNLGAPMALDPITHQASFTVTWNLPIGNHVIKARYPGNPNFLAVNTAGYSLVITAH
jgi:beta-glucosidase-like glycosyl hydrolase